MRDDMLAVGELAHSMHVVTDRSHESVALASLKRELLDYFFFKLFFLLSVVPESVALASLPRSASGVSICTAVRVKQVK
jgi:hypothetical protein